MEALSLPSYIAREYLPSHLSLTRWPLSGVFDTHISQAVALGLVQFLELNDACECVLQPWGATAGAKCSPPNGWSASCSALHLPWEGTGKWSSEPLGVRGLPADSATSCPWGQQRLPELGTLLCLRVLPGSWVKNAFLDGSIRIWKKKGKIVLTWWDSG